MCARTALIPLVPLCLGLFALLLPAGAAAQGTTPPETSIDVAPPADTTDPTIDVVTPAVKEHFLLHSGSADYTCDDPLSGGPPSVASGVTASGCVDTGFDNDIELGPRLITFTATDRAGNSTSATRAYVIDPRDYGEFITGSDPIAYYRLDEQVGSADMKDRSGNGHDGSYQNGIALGRDGATSCERRPHPPRACETASPDRNNAGWFPARDGHGYANGIAAPTTAYTLEAWVKPADGADMMIAAHGGGGQIFISGGKLAFRQTQDTIQGGGPTLTPGEWWHVAATWNGSTSRLYVNGNQVGSSTAANEAPSGISTFFVGYGDQAPWFHGDLDEVAYYDRALSGHAFRDRHAIGTATDHPSLGNGDLNTAGPSADAEAPQNDGLYAPAKVPNAEFSCDDPDGAGDVQDCSATADGAPIGNGDPLPAGAGSHSLVITAADRHGNSFVHTHTYEVKDFSSIIGHDVPIAYYRLGDGAGATMVDASPSGHHGEYRNGQESGPVGISGDGDHARVFHGAGGYGYVNGITAPKHQATLEAWINPADERDQAIVGHGDAGELYIRNGQFRFRHMDTTVTASVAPRLGAWQHVVGVWDGVEIHIYVNGVEAGSEAATKRPSSTSTFYVGFGELAQWFKGAIDEVAYYDIALSPDRVFQRWLAKSPGDPGPAGVSGGGSGSGGGADAMDARIVGKPKLNRNALRFRIRCVGNTDCGGTARARLKLGRKTRSLGTKPLAVAAGKKQKLRFKFDRKLRHTLAKRGGSAKLVLESPSGRHLDTARTG